MMFETPEVTGFDCIDLDTNGQNLLWPDSDIINNLAGIAGCPGCLEHL